MLLYREGHYVFIFPLPVSFFRFPCSTRGAEVRIVGPVDVEEIAVTLARAYGESKGYGADEFTVDYLEDQRIFD